MNKHTKLLLTLLAAVFFAGGTMAFADSYVLKNHPDGNAAEPYYGLRLDGLWTGDSSDIFTFDFDHAGSSMTLDVNGTDLHISGTVVGGQDIGGSYANNTYYGSYEVDFTYENTTYQNGTYYSYGTGNNSGTITFLGNGTTFSLIDKADNSGTAFTFLDHHRGADNSGWGWLNHSGGKGHLSASDWLFTAERVPDGGSTVLMLGMGSLLILFFRRRQKVALNH